MTAALELDGVDKRFGAVHAVRLASLAFERGHIHAVVGENGAGKSTLLRIGAGLLTPDAGQVRIEGRRLEPHVPAEAIRRGVAMVEQHFALVEAFTALENIVLGVEPVRSPAGRLDLAFARARAERISRELGAEIPLDAPVATLGVGQKQRLEIARALYREAKVVILDEPTAVLTPVEADALYLTLRRLADAGRAVIVVTHKLDEVQKYADVATVVRRGKVLETADVRRTSDDAARLAAAIMGNEPIDVVERVSSQLGGAVLQVKELHVGRALHGVNLEVRAGEVVGVAGVDGNGQHELVRVLAGLERPDRGTVAPAPDALCVVHEDRHREGLVLDASVRDNVTLGDLAALSRGGLVDSAALEREASSRVSRAQAPPDLSAPARALSGGNQQKLVVARAISRAEENGARALVMAHPTRGVDLAASRLIHTEILGAAARGLAVLVVSADLQELRTVCDRLVVIARGAICAELPVSADDAEIGRAMLLGVQAGGAARPASAGEEASR